MPYPFIFRAAFAALVMLALGLTLPAVAQAPSVAPPPRVPNGAYVGGFCNTLGKGATQADKEACLEQLEAQAGRRMAIQLSYYTYWNLKQQKLLADPMIQGDLKYHRIPLISQTCGTPLTNYRPGGVAQKSVDNAMTAMKAYPGPIIFTWFHEFDGCLRGATNTCTHNGDNPRCFTPGFAPNQKMAQFKAAWDFVVSERNRLGATNVAMGWRTTDNPNAGGYYPGDSQVDWILPDVYDRHGTGFIAAVSPTYEAYCTPAFTAKPCGLAELGETGCGSGASAQAAFLNEIAASVPSRFPNMHLLAWFNAHTNADYDWRLDNCGGLQAFTRVVNLPYFKVMPY